MAEFNIARHLGIEASEPVQGWASNPSPNPAPQPSPNTEREAGEATEGGNAGFNPAPGPTLHPDPTPEDPWQTEGSDGTVKGVHGFEQKLDIENQGCSSTNPGNPLEAEVGVQPCTPCTKAQLELIPSPGAQLKKGLHRGANAQPSPANTGSPICVDGEAGWRLPGGLPKAPTAGVTRQLAHGSSVVCSSRVWNRSKDPTAPARHLNSCR